MTSSSKAHGLAAAASVGAIALVAASWFVWRGTGATISSSNRVNAAPEVDEDDPTWQGTDRVRLSSRRRHEKRTAAANEQGGRRRGGTVEATYTSNPRNAPDCPLGVRVAIAAQANEPSGSLAMLRHNGTTRASQLTHRGDALEGWRVWHIGTDRVWMWGPEGACQVRMYEGSPPPAASSAPRTEKDTTGLPQSIRDGIRQLGPTEFQVERAVVEQVFERLGQYIKVRVQPEIKDGVTVGMRLASIPPGSLLSLIGLKPGDRLDAVNGFRVADPQVALEALARLRLASDLVVSVERNGRPMNIDVHVR